MSVLSKFSKENLDDDVFTGTLSPYGDAVAKYSDLMLRQDKLQEEKERNMSGQVRPSRIMSGANGGGYYPTPSEMEAARYINDPEYRKAVKQGQRENALLAVQNQADSEQYNEPIGLMGMVHNGAEKVRNSINNNFIYPMENFMQPASDYAGVIKENMFYPYDYAREQLRRPVAQAYEWYKE